MRTTAALRAGPQGGVVVGTPGGGEGVRGGRAQAAIDDDLESQAS